MLVLKHFKSHTSTYTVGILFLAYFDNLVIKTSIKKHERSLINPRSFIKFKFERQVKGVLTILFSEILPVNS